MEYYTQRCSRSKITSNEEKEMIKSMEMHKSINTWSIVNTYRVSQPISSRRENQSTSSNWLSLWSSEDIRSMQENDIELAEILKFRVESNQKPDRSRFRRLSDTMKYFLCHWESLEEKDGILYFRKESENPMHQF